MNYQHVNYLWNDADASKLDPVGRLIYRSNLLGSDQRITNTGGGNTSAKILEQDPLTGEKVEVPAKRVPYFKPSKELKDLINGETTAAAAPPPAPSNP